MAPPIGEPLQMLTPAQAQRLLAGRLRAARVLMGFKQKTLADRAGVTLATLRRFEQTGEVSLKYLLRICHALGRLDELENLFRPPPASSIAELESRVLALPHKRGSR